MHASHLSLAPLLLSCAALTAGCSSSSPDTDAPLTCAPGETRLQGSIGTKDLTQSAATGVTGTLAQTSDASFLSVNTPSGLVLKVVWAGFEPSGTAFAPTGGILNVEDGSTSDTYCVGQETTVTLQDGGATFTLGLSAPVNGCGASGPPASTATVLGCWNP
jgi:hypothetical protein